MEKILAIALSGALLGAASPVAEPRTGSVERTKVHGKLLEGNLSGDSPDRSVTVYLPPSYHAARNKRYPVLYMLHGYTDNDEKWMGLVKHWINLPTVIDKAVAAKESREMIVVMPDGFTRFQGSMYSNSVTTGDWEDFIASELVAYIDAHYRTVPSAASRGLAGHSMGGYGAMRIGMKHPEVFAAVYLLSPCCLAAPDVQRDSAFMPEAEAVREVSQIDKTEFMPRIMLASAAAWSPNPGNPPLYLDLPWKDGQWQADIAGKWAGNAPLETIDQYITNLKRLKGLGFDAGDKDQPIAGNIGRLDEALTANAVPHLYEVYQGDHLNRIAERIETKVLPFFSKSLSFPAARRSPAPHRRRT
jgi:S-formylglutathione hydrolase